MMIPAYAVRELVRFLGGFVHLAEHDDDDLASLGRKAKHLLGFVQHRRQRRRAPRPRKGMAK